MTHSTRSILLMLLFAGIPLVAQSSEYMLFSPRPVEGEVLMPERGKEVLVKRITIKKGDTLSQLSRDFSGKGSYFSQILLFNDINDPNRIFAGKKLLVPISMETALSKTPDTGESTSKSLKKDSVARSVPAKTTVAKPAAPAKEIRPVSKAKVAKEKKLAPEEMVDKRAEDSYALAINAYRAGKYQESLSLFSRFLELYPSSSLAADASLYKAESLLKLSRQ